MPVNIEANKDNNKRDKYRVEGTHSIPQLLPVLSKKEASVSQAGAPDEGTEEGID